MNDPLVMYSLAVAAVSALLLLLGEARRRRVRDPQRFFSWEQKKALIAQARRRCEHKAPLWLRCAAPGTEADHVRPWSRGGPTQLWNGQLLCRRHNTQKSNWMPTGIYRWRLQQRRKRYTP